MGYPQPNEYGVYDKDDAIEYAYKDRLIHLTVHILQVEENVWLYAVSFTKKSEGGGGTMGLGSPIAKVKDVNKIAGQVDPATAHHALSCARQKVGQIAATGKSESEGARHWIAAWRKVDVWGVNLARQPDLFDSLKEGN